MGGCIGRPPPQIWGDRPPSPRYVTTPDDNDVYVVDDADDYDDDADADDYVDDVDDDDDDSLKLQSKKCVCEIRIRAAITGTLITQSS